MDVYNYNAGTKKVPFLHKSSEVRVTSCVRQIL